MRALLLLPLLASSLAAQSQAVLAALATGTYFPLDVGDRWVFRTDNRFVTGAYEVWRVDRTQDYGGQTYSVIAIEGASGVSGESWFRADSSGRVYVLTGNGEQVFLDPTARPDPAAQLRVTGQVKTITSPFGTFVDGLNYSNEFPGNLLLENGTLVRGIGLVTSAQILQTGSSGGFTSGRNLIEASLAGGIHFAMGTPSIQLGMESLTLNLSAKFAPNCAVPCYFVACYLAPGADLPGTYKPCARARVSLANWPIGSSRMVELQFLAPDGTVLFDSRIVLDADPGKAVNDLQVPLYSASNQPFAPGTYKLVAATADGSAQSSLAIQLQ